jgi:hypothetical protein
MGKHSGATSLSTKERAKQAQSVIANGLNQLGNDEQKFANRARREASEEEEGGRWSVEQIEC